MFLLSNANYSCDVFTTGTYCDIICIEYNEGGVFMESTNLNIRIDKEVKIAAERIFEELGLNMTTAVNIFLRQTIRENGIPFELKLSVPNDVTAAAIEEGRKLAYDKTASGYTNMNDLKAALDL